MARPKKYAVRTVEDLTHRRWCAMHYRVNSQDRHKHATICNEWQDYNKFKEDMGECPEGFSLERKDNTKGYNKDNCKWIPVELQSNNRRTNHMYNGYSLKRACEKVGLPYKTVFYHLRKYKLEPLEAILKVAGPSKRQQVEEALNESVDI